ncbi:MAG: hypothetical protein HC865_20395 [Cyanobacteria bacterium RU_5_0]|nr:hypothetical protein [Cyanobacteria bacterium RU_5_0]
MLSLTRIEQLLDGRYQVTQVLARGGFGQTYLAIDTRRPGQPVCVVKQLRSITNNPQILPTGLPIEAIRSMIDPNHPSAGLEGWHDGIPINSRLMAILDKMVHPDYRQRYQSAETILSDLNDLSGSNHRQSATTVIPPNAASSPSPFSSSEVLEPAQTTAKHSNVSQIWRFN